MGGRERRAAGAVALLLAAGLVREVEPLREAVRRGWGGIVLVVAEVVLVVVKEGAVVVVVVVVGAKTEVVTVVEVGGVVVVVVARVAVVVAKRVWRQVVACVGGGKGAVKASLAPPMKGVAVAMRYAKGAGRGSTPV